MNGRSEKAVAECGVAGSNTFKTFRPSSANLVTYVCSPPTRITWPFHRSLEAASSRPIKNSARDGDTILRWRKSHMILFPVAQSAAWQES